ncbi:MAG: hypothetical protein V1846_03255 [Candidatus Komeilibacteria bacterium]
MSVSKGRIIVIITALFILAVIVVTSRALFSTGQVVPNFFMVPKVLISSAIKLDKIYSDTSNKLTWRYPSDWLVQDSSQEAKPTPFKAQQLLSVDPRLPFVEISHVMISSQNYPLECQNTDPSLEACAGRSLITGGFLDLHVMYHREVTMADIMATATTTWVSSGAISESPIKLAGRAIYEWNGLNCGPKCYILRALIIPLGEHTTIQLFANVYVNENLNQQDLANTLRSYQEQLDAIIASLTIQ